LTDSDAVPLSQIPALTINKTVTAVDGDIVAPFLVDAAGDVIFYSILVTNTGNQTLTGVTVSDPRITNLVCTWPGTAGTLLVTQSVTCTGSYTVLQSDIDNNGDGDGDIDNTATADSAQTVPLTDSDAVPLSQIPALTISKTASPKVYDYEGQVINYSFIVTNSGNVTLTAPFTVLDSKTTNEACPPTPTLNPTQFITCTASYTIKKSDMTNGTVTNVANATGKFGASTITSLPDTETVTASHTLTYNFLPIVQIPYPSGVQVIPVSYNYVSHGTLFIIGEVLNNTTNPITWVKVVANLFDADDKFLGTANTYLWPVDLPAFEKGCFKISLPIPTNWSYYQFQNLTYDVSNTSSGLSIISHIGSLNPDKGYVITGQVRNSGNQRSNDVRVSGTLYNIQGEPVGCEHSLVESTYLNPGQVSSFQRNYFYRDYSDVTSYKLRVAGDLP
jgi:hypothetical protein